MGTEVAHFGTPATELSAIVVAPGFFTEWNILMKNTNPADLTACSRRIAIFLKRLTACGRGSGGNNDGGFVPSTQAGPVNGTAFVQSPFRAILCASLCALPASCTGANHFYVATTGSDANPGTQAAPFLTIAQADSRASAGDTIHVAPGIYRVSAPSLHSNGILTTKSGTSSARIKFVSDVKWAAKIVVSGIGTAWHSKGSYVDIDGFDISGSGRHGILAAGSNLTISNNFVHDLTVSGGCNGSGGAGIDTYGPVVVINANVVRNIGYRMSGSCNFVHGIYVANRNNTVTNNIVSGAAAVGINQWHGATAGTIVNNITFNNKIGILLGQGDSGATSAGSQNNYVANNIVYDNKTYGIVEGGKIGGNNRYVNNLVHSSGTNLRVQGAVSGTISADPLFVDYQANGSGDYRLQSKSPAVGRGAGTKVLPADRPGTTVGTPDLGAYGN